EKRISSREHEAVEVAVGCEAKQYAPIVDADAESLDGSRRAQFTQRPMRARHRFSVALLDEIALPAPIDVVYEHDVERVGAQTLQAVLDRAHRAIVAVVVAHREWIGGRAGPGSGAAHDGIEQNGDLWRRAG